MPLFLLQLSPGDDLVFSIKIILNALTLLLCILACYTDLSKGRVPNWLTMPFLLIGLALQYIAGGWSENNILSLSHSVGGLLTGGGFMLLLYFIGGLGGGDVKLFAAIGALKDQPFIIQAVLNACLVGGTLALFQIIFRWITFNPHAEQQKIINPTPKIQVVSEPELTVEQKKELARKQREADEKKKAEAAANPASENTTPDQAKPLHPEDPEAEVTTPALTPATTSPEAEILSPAQTSPLPPPKGDSKGGQGGTQGDLLPEDEEKKLGIPFGFAISLGVLITFIITPNV